MEATQSTLKTVAEEPDDDCTDGCRCDLPNSDVPCHIGYIEGGDEWPEIEGEA